MNSITFCDSCGERILDGKHPTCRFVGKDPQGKDQHQPGAKLDLGKNQVGLMIEGFPRALEAVAEVTTYGAKKYTPNGWKSVPDAEKRYTDAMYRHLLKFSAGEIIDKESGLPHLAHACWNMLAVQELVLRRQNEKESYVSSGEERT